MCRTRARRRLNSHDQAILEILAIVAKELATGDIQRVRDWGRQDRRLLCGHPSGVGGRQVGDRQADEASQGGAACRSEEVRRQVVMRCKPSGSPQK